MINTELVKRNVEEIVTEEELDTLLKGKKSPVTYCGYETSGPVHIGTLIAVGKQLDFQNAGLKVKVLLADVHTHLNRKGGEEWIESMVEYWKECFIGYGLTKAEYTRGTEFQFDEDYVKDVLNLGLNSTLNRALRSMQEIARDIEHATVSQVIYPLMQVIDIKALEVDIAHGGMEQRKIHMLARETLPLIGYKKPVCIHTPLLCSLQAPTKEDKEKEPLSEYGVFPRPKMSSSKPETMIALHESEDSIKKKINNAYCPPDSGGNPILDICKLLLFPRIERIKIKRNEKFGGDIIYNDYFDLEKDYLNKKLHPADLKNSVGENLSELLRPVREHLKRKGIEYKSAN